MRVLISKLTNLNSLYLCMANMTSYQTEMLLDSIRHAPFLTDLAFLVLRQSLNLSNDAEVLSLIEIMNATPNLHTLQIQFQTGNR